MSETRVLNTAAAATMSTAPTILTHAVKSAAVAAATPEDDAVAAVPEAELSAGAASGAFVPASAASSAAAAPAFESALGSTRDIRVAVIGNVDAGKSTLIGVLTSGVLDDARGSARGRVFHFKHEQDSGRTSAVGHHIMGFDAESRPVFNTVTAAAKPAQKNKAWHAVVSRSRQLVTFIDLAGHARYLKTTVSGLTGCYPDVALVIVNSLAGVTKMTREHLGIAVALGLPLCVVVSKIDRAYDNHLKEVKSQLSAVLKSRQANKLPVTVRSEADVDKVLADTTFRATPIFYVSAVTGQHVDLLQRYLAHITPARYAAAAAAAGAGAGESAESAGASEAAAAAAALRAAPTEMRIDERFQVTGVGLVLSGTVTAGTLTAGQKMLLGPDARGGFCEVSVKSVHCKRIPVTAATVGDSCSVALKPLPAPGRAAVASAAAAGFTLIPPPANLAKNFVRHGMVLVSPGACPRASWAFDTELVVLHHPTSIFRNFQAVVHCGTVRQTAAIEAIAGRDILVTGDTACVRLRFLNRAELLRPGEIFLFRDGSTKGLGRVIGPVAGAPPTTAGMTARVAAGRTSRLRRATASLSCHSLNRSPPKRER